MTEHIEMVAALISVSNEIDDLLARWELEDRQMLEQKPEREMLWLTDNTPRTTKTCGIGYISSTTR